MDAGRASPGRKELLSPEWAERILSWPHTGFNVHSHIFIARVTSHIPDKGQVMFRYYGLYANAHIYRSPEADVRGGEAPALMESLTLLPEYRPKRPPSHVFEQVALLEVEESGEYCRVFCDQGGAEVYCFLTAAEGFLVPIGSSGAVFAIIDIAARPEI